LTIAYQVQLIACFHDDLTQMLKLRVKARLATRQTYMTGAKEALLPAGAAAG